MNKKICFVVLTLTVMNYFLLGCQSSVEEQTNKKTIQHVGEYEKLKNKVIELFEQCQTSGSFGTVYGFHAINDSLILFIDRSDSMDWQEDKYAKNIEGFKDVCSIPVNSVKVSLRMLGDNSPSIYFICNKGKSCIETISTSYSYDRSLGNHKRTEKEIFFGLTLDRGLLI